MEVGSSSGSAPVQAQVAVQKKAAKQEEKVVGTILSSIDTANNDPRKGGRVNVFG